jgi:hypothetical protein
VSEEKLNYDLKITTSGAHVMPKLTEEDFEKLKALKVSSQWKLYRQILIAVRDGHSQSLAPMEDSNRVFKTLGMIAGLNLAVVQLDLLVEQFDKAKRVPAESKKPVQPAQ